MNESLKDVKKFHDTFQVPTLTKPQIPSKDRSDLRITLLQEELDEIKEAIKNNDVVEILDGLCDLLYILNGTVLEFGMGDVFDKAFSEVQKSNMSKTCDSMQEAILTLAHYKRKDGTEGYYKESNGKYIVYRNTDNKVLKSINYKPVDFTDILNG